MQEDVTVPAALYETANEPLDLSRISVRHDHVDDAWARDVHGASIGSTVLMRAHQVLSGLRAQLTLRSVVGRNVLRRGA